MTSPRPSSSCIQPLIQNERSSTARICFDGEAGGLLAADRAARQPLAQDLPDPVERAAQLERVLARDDGRGGERVEHRRARPASSEASSSRTSALRSPCARSHCSRGQLDSPPGGELQLDRLARRAAVADRATYLDRRRVPLSTAAAPIRIATSDASSPRATPARRARASAWPAFSSMSSQASIATSSSLLDQAAVHLQQVLDVGVHRVRLADAVAQRAPQPRAAPSPSRSSCARL